MRLYRVPQTRPHTVIEKLSKPRMTSHHRRSRPIIASSALNVSSRRAARRYIQRARAPKITKSGDNIFLGRGSTITEIKTLQLTTDFDACKLSGVGYTRAFPPGFLMWFRGRSSSRLAASASTWTLETVRGPRLSVVLSPPWGALHYFPTATSEYPHIPSAFRSGLPCTEALHRVTPARAFPICFNGRKNIQCISRRAAL